MLIEFRVENHRSIRTEQVLTFEAGRVGADDDRVPRSIGSLSLLPAIAVYGANASGKSNLLSALQFMRDAVMLSHRSWPPEGGVPRVPFAWSGGQNEPSLFEVVVVLDGVRYQYGFVADDVCFREEWLFAWPKGRKQVWFERDRDQFKFGENFGGHNKIFQTFTRPNALYLSVAIQHRHRDVIPVYDWFHLMRIVDVEGHAVSLRGRYPRRFAEDWVGHDSGQTGLFDENSGSRMAELRSLLRAADVGIVDVEVVDADADRPQRTFGRRWQINVRHQNESDDAWLPLEQESQGTRTLFRIAPYLLDAIRNGGLTVLDELESSLHPLLALHIVRLFNDPALNPLNAQLLFTTHDTNLLGSVVGEPALRRDQVWLTEKDDQGASCVYPLTDYKPRKSENLERGYLQGRYGAIPFLGALAGSQE